MTPSIGQFLGLPLDVRHVTLSTGTMALAAESLDYRWFGEGGIARALAGIAVMFVEPLGQLRALARERRPRLRVAAARSRGTVGPARPPLSPFARRVPVASAQVGGRGLPVHG